MPTTILVAPAGRRVGLTTACLGLVRALDRQGIRVAFVKPVANREVSQSAELVALGAHIMPVKSVPSHMAEELLASGDDQTLMEHVVDLAGRAGVGADVLIVDRHEPRAGHRAREPGERVDAEPISDRQPAVAQSEPIGFMASRDLVQQE